MSDEKKKTADEILLATKKQEQDEFQQVFNEVKDGDPEFKKQLEGDDEHIDKDDDKKGTALTNGGEPEKKEAAADVAKIDNVVQPDNTADVDNEKTANLDLFKEDGEEPGAKPDTTPPVDADLTLLKTENAELKSQVAALENKMKSWEGRIKKANERADKAEADAKQKVTDTVTAAASGDPAALEKFKTDFPEFIEPIKMLVAEVAGNGVSKEEIIEAVQPQLDDVKKDNKETKETVSASIILAAHNDARTIYEQGLLPKWIATQPDYIKPTLQRVYDSGTAEELVKLISEFKRTTGYGKTTTDSKQTDEDKQKKLREQLTVESDGSGPPASEPDKDDYNAAAAEAFSE